LGERGLTHGCARHSQLGVKLRDAATPPPAAQAEQEGVGLASAAAPGKLVFKGASTVAQECKLLMDRKFLEFILLQCEEECAFINSHCHSIFTAWQGVSYANGKGKHSTSLNEYG